MKKLELSVDDLGRRHAEWTAQWHEAPTPPPTGLPWAALEENHRMNFALWHEEDIARRDDLGAERVRQSKRAIDRSNQSRNDAIEKIDLWLLDQLPPAAPDSPQHSETPGMIMDRLSILSLKVYHMRIEAQRESAAAEVRDRCRVRCAILEEQMRALKSCLEILLADLQNGRRHFKLYRQLKMYNDPSLNPQLYGGKSDVS